jgi:hypothetical protein
MGTKNKPWNFDCYASAEPDEPMFVLLARDPLAPFLVSIWSKVSCGDAEAAHAVFKQMMEQLSAGYEVVPDPDKASEALDCSFAMFDWYKNYRAA